MKSIILFIATAILWAFMISESLAHCEDEPEPDEYQWYITYLV